MKFLPLIFANLGRRKIRTVLTLGSVFVAFLLFGLLMAVKAGFGVGVELTGADRLVTKHKTSLILPLPESYGREIARSTASPTSPTPTGSAASTRIRRTSFRPSPSSPRRTCASIPRSS